MSARQDPFDFEVIGGGTAGGVLAARLSASAGPGAATGGWLGRRIACDVGAGGVARADGGVEDWGFTTVPQTGLENRVLDFLQGKVLGGSSSVNALMNVRGHLSAIDAWNVPGWGAPTFSRTTGAENTPMA